MGYLHLTEYARTELLIISLTSAVAAAVAVVLGYWPVAVCVLLTAGLVMLFFRDPSRTVPNDKTVLLAPADGTVTELTHLDHPQLACRAIKIGIFLSIFNVHINRSPCAANVLQVTAKKGKFLNAMSHTSSDQNTCTELLLEPTVQALPPKIFLRQISGLIARTIVCTPTPGQSLQAGQRFGMIKFGSRTELIVPLTPTGQVQVKLGQKVKAGLDVLVKYPLSQDN